MTRGSPRFPPHITPFRMLVLAGLCLGIPGIVAAAMLVRSVLLPLASACLQACARDPLLMNLARVGAATAVAAVVGSTVAGGAVLAAQLRSTRRLYRDIATRVSSPSARVERLARRLGMEGQLTYVRDPRPYAFCYGLLNPRICLSSGMARTLMPQELQAVLLHELHHLRRRDPLKVLICRTVAGALFLLPVAGQILDRFLLEKEIAADAEVVGRLSIAPLAGAILKLYRTPSPYRYAPAAAIGSFDLMGERIRHLTGRAGRTSPSRRKKAATLAVVLALLLVSVGSVYAASESVPGGGSCCPPGATCPLPGGDTE